MRRRLALRSLASCALALALAAAVPPAAGARRFQMSGSWVMRNGQLFLPLQFVAGLVGPMGTPLIGWHASMGNLTGAFGFPNGPIPGLGGVTATASAPAALRIPRHRFVMDAMAALPLSGVSLAQITTRFGVDAPYAPATLAPGGGPGAFTWCPTDPLCVDAPGTMLASDPAHGAGPRAGRIVYRAGANQFGGAMQIGLRRGGVNSFIFAQTPNVRVGHVIFGGSGSTLRALPLGGLGGPDQPASAMAYLAAGFITQPLTFMAGALIANPGPKLTTMFGLTNTMAGPTLYLDLGETAMGARFGQLTTNYGFAHTTGTVLAQVNTGSYIHTFFTFMGSDVRTALGAGNLSLVAGGVSFRNTSAGTTPYANAHKVWLTLGAPVPSLSPGGLAAAAALLLLGVGYANRRRLG